MRTVSRTASLALLLCVLTLGARAETLQLPEPALDRSTLPVRGLSMQQVQEQFGRPLLRYAPVGGGHPKRPPITRWDYEAYSVFFENDRVIDAVVRGEPKPLRNVEQLQTETSTRY